MAIGQVASQFTIYNVQLWGIAMKGTFLRLGLVSS